MSDAALLQNLKERGTVTPDSFNNKQWKYLPDISNGDYTQQISFDTQKLANSWVNYYEGYLFIPLGVSSTQAETTSSDGTFPMVAFKQSFLSLIAGIQINRGDGLSIVAENNIQFINNLRLMVEKSLDWTTSEGAEIQFAMDTSRVNNPNPYATTTSVANLAFNRGFSDRMIFIMDSAVQTGSYSSATTASYYQINALIPLRLLHSFFDSMNFPLINTRFLINFILASPIGNQGNGITCLQAETTATIASSPPTAILANAYGIVTVPSTNFIATPTGIKVIISTNGTQAAGAGACRLYYNTVTLNEHDAQEAIAQLKMNKPRRMEFISTDTYINLIGAKTMPLGLFSQIINAATVKPIRIWALYYPANANYASSSLQTATNSTPQIVAGAIGAGSAVNVKISNNQYLENFPTTSNEMWQYLKEQFPNYGGAGNTLGSLINYDSFLNLYRYHCFDVSRVKDRLKNSSDPVQIELDATLTAITPYDGSGPFTTFDAVYIVEKANVAVFHFSSSEVQITVGQNQ